MQEELGLRGVRTLARHAKPEVAIILEGTPADDTPGFRPDESQGVMEGGVQIRMHDPSAIMSPRLADLAIDTAEREKIPYQLAVNVDGYTERARLISIDATIWVERKGQKAIVIGTRGQVLKAVGVATRREMEALLRRKVFLRLWVKVREDWSDNEAALQHLGYGG